MKFSGSVYFLCGCLFALLIFSQFSFVGPAFKRDANVPVWNAPPMPAALSFAGERVPLDRWDVKEKFDKELLNTYYAQGNILYVIKLASRNFPTISSRLKANGVPDDFKYLCIAESNMQSWALSKAGAVGYWQFMNGVGTGYGLETNDQVDQRMDLEKSTDAACKFFKQAYERFGNWTAAAASYNCGQGGYHGQASFQGTNNYYDLNLPEETNKYIYRILSFKYLMENADALGFNVGDADKYQTVPTRTVKVTNTVSNLVQFARDNGTTYKIIRLLNPWLKGRSLPVRHGASYEVKLPLPVANASAQR